MKCSVIKYGLKYILALKAFSTLNCPQRLTMSIKLLYTNSLLIQDRGPQPVGCSTLWERGLLSTGLCEWLAGAHAFVCACTRPHTTHLTSCGRIFIVRARCPIHMSTCMQKRTCPSTPSGPPTQKGWGTVIQGEDADGSHEKICQSKIAFSRVSWTLVLFFR